MIRARAWTEKRAAVVVGVLFVIATASGVASVAFLQPALTAPDWVISFALAETAVIAGAMLDLLGAAAFVALSIAIWPVMARYSRRLALTYVVARSFEAVLFVIANLILLSVLTLSRSAAAAGNPDGATSAVAAAMRAAYDWTQLLGPRILASLAALPFYYALFKGRLVPRWLSVWGLVAAPLYLASGILPMLGLASVSSALLTAFFIPAALLEMVLAVWLIVRGFDSQDSGLTAQSSARQSPGCRSEHGR